MLITAIVLVVFSLAFIGWGIHEVVTNKYSRSATLELFGGIATFITVVTVFTMAVAYTISSEMSADDRRERITETIDELQVVGQVDVKELIRDGHFTLRDGTILVLNDDDTISRTEVVK